MIWFLITKHFSWELQGKEGQQRDDAGNSDKSRKRDHNYYRRLFFLKKSFHHVTYLPRNVKGHPLSRAFCGHSLGCIETHRLLWPHSLSCLIAYDAFTRTLDSFSSCQPAPFLNQIKRWFLSVKTARCLKVWCAYSFWKFKESFLICGSGLFLRTWRSNQHNFRNPYFHKN